jgi:hypothetical protein
MYVHAEKAQATKAYCEVATPHIARRVNKSHRKFQYDARNAHRITVRKRGARIRIRIMVVSRSSSRRRRRRRRSGSNDVVMIIRRRFHCDSQPNHGLE